MERSREEYNQAVREARNLVAIGREEIVLPLLAVAIRFARVNKLMRVMRKAGLDWSNTKWVDLWFKLAAGQSLEPGVWLIDQGRLREWIRKGRLDDQSPLMLDLVAAHPERDEFSQMVEKRLIELSRERKIDLVDSV